MRLVVIESPYAGDVERNLRYLDAALADCFARGESPFASHGLYTRKGVLDDRIPDERARGIRAGFAWGAKADLVAVYEDLGVTPGMLAGIERAEKRGTPVERRRLPEWDPVRVLPVESSISSVVCGYCDGTVPPGGYCRDCGSPLHDGGKPHPDYTHPSVTADLVAVDDRLDGVLDAIENIIKYAVFGAARARLQVADYLRQTADRMRYLARDRRAANKRDLVLGVRRLTEMADWLEREP